ncbi:hypothetical protein F9L07_03025 [Pimelobacter simplex]|uniref:Uncharacterized protein n=1 Tax=Nocardioides simplex TaxID=2045 RepID=A0A7J5DY46_NOCSI|nr:hypothetical protein F9L07_03025 [Pimelobacter simplex]
MRRSVMSVQPQLVRRIGVELVPGPALVVDHGAQVGVTGGPGFFNLPFFGLPNALHQPWPEQICHGPFGHRLADLSQGADLRSSTYCTIVLVVRSYK